VWAALEAIRRIGKLSHAATFFRHGDTAGVNVKVADVIIAASVSILVANSPTLH
jgi:hypothetical protein